MQVCPGNVSRTVHLNLENYTLVSVIPTGYQDTDLVSQCTHLFQGCRICKTGNGDVTLPHHVSMGFPQPSSLLSKGPALLGTSIR